MNSFSKIVLSAAYGMGNMGDEAICESIVNDILTSNPKVAITVLVFDKDNFYKAHPGWSDRSHIKIKPIDSLGIVWPLIMSDLFIWGGGGLVRNRQVWLKKYIKPLRLAKLMNKRVIVCSIGVDKVTDPSVKDLIQSIDDAWFISARDYRSKENLSEVLSLSTNDKIAVIRDPAFHLRDFYSIKREKNSSEPKIGINLSFWKADYDDKENVSKFAKSLAQILNNLSEKIRFSIVYLPTVPSKDNQVFDLLSKNLSAKIRVLRPDVSTVEKYLTSLSETEVFIGMRLHSIILASNIDNLPIFVIEYDDKVRSLVSECNFKNSYSIDEIRNSENDFIEDLLSCLGDSDRYIKNFEEFRTSSRFIKEYITKV